LRDVADADRGIARVIRTTRARAIGNPKNKFRMPLLTLNFRVISRQYQAEMKQNKNKLGFL
jgi:hypothetical protein